jgi:hypothetical protein
LLGDVLQRRTRVRSNQNYQVEGRLKEKYVVEAPASASMEEVVAFVRQNPRPECSEGKTGPWCDYPVTVRMPLKATGPTMDPTIIYVALGVPAGALLIGYGFFWALSGFRRT